MNTVSSRRIVLLGLALLAAAVGRLGAQVLSRNSFASTGRAATATEVSCGPTTLTESVTQDIVGGNSIACQDQATGFTYENHYTRAFELTSFGVGGAFAVCEVEVAVEI